MKSFFQKLSKKKSTGEDVINKKISKKKSTDEDDSNEEDEDNSNKEFILPTDIDLSKVHSRRKYDFDDISDDNTSQISTRSRSSAISLDPTEFKESTEQIKLSRSTSVEAQSQGNEGTCFAYASARCITRLITKILPNSFNLTEQDIEKLGSKDDRYINCFITKGDNAIVRKTLAFANKCPIPKKYNHMIIFYYTFLTIKRDYGCEGGEPSEILDIFSESISSFYNIDTEIIGNNDSLITKNRRGFIISKEVDEAARIIIRKFIEYIYTNNISISVNKDIFDLNNQSYQHNWITDFPDGAKEALSNQMYIAFSYKLPESQRIQNRPDRVYTIQPAQDFACNDVVGHSVVITNWEPPNDSDSQAYVTFINSWGRNWGNKGFIRIPSNYYDKFVMKPICETSIIYNNEGRELYNGLIKNDTGEIVSKDDNIDLYNRNMELYNKKFGLEFVYFVLEKNSKPYILPSITGTISRPLFPPSGGKTKKHKHKKSKRKTVIRKKNKSKKNHKK